MRHGMGVDVVFEDETRHQLTYVEERVTPEALRSEEPHADDGSVLVLTKRTLGAFPLPVRSCG